MNILFVYSVDDAQSVSSPLRMWSSVQLGISYISSVLKREGFNTSLAVLSSENLRDAESSLRREIQAKSPSVICWTSVYTQYEFVSRMAGYVKKIAPEIKNLIGGVHATLNPESVIDGPFDALCVGEGEYPALEYCNQVREGKAPSAIANLWIRHADGSVQRNEPRPFIEALDELPFPDREMWRPWIREQLGGEMVLMLGRGCPFDCTYCCNHALRKVAAGQYVRMRSPGNIVEELDEVTSVFSHENIYFEVETIALNKDWLEKLCEELALFNRRLGRSIRYGCNLRVSSALDRETFQQLKTAGFDRVNVGLESGSERVRREVLKRKYTNDDFLRMTGLSRDAGLKINIFNMIGLPGETLEEHMATVRVNRLVQPDHHYTGIFFPYPGTELWRMCIEQGICGPNPSPENERRKPVAASEEFPAREIRKSYLWFDYRVYRGHKPLAVVLLRVLVVWLQSHRSLRRAFRAIVQWPVLRRLRASLAKM